MSTIESLPTTSSVIARKRNSCSSGNKKCKRTKKKCLTKIKESSATSSKLDPSTCTQSTSTGKKASKDVLEATSDKSPREEATSSVAVVVDNTNVLGIISELCKVPKEVASVMSWAAVDYLSVRVVHSRSELFDTFLNKDIEDSICISDLHIAGRDYADDKLLDLSQIEGHPRYLVISKHLFKLRNIYHFINFIYLLYMYSNYYKDRLCLLSIAAQRVYICSYISESNTFR